MVIFHSYVSLPEGKHSNPRCLLLHVHICWCEAFPQPPRYDSLWSIVSPAFLRTRKTLWVWRRCGPVTGCDEGHHLVGQVTSSSQYVEVNWRQPIKSTKKRFIIPNKHPFCQGISSKLKYIVKPNLNHQPEEPSPCKIPGIKSWWRQMKHLAS
jgi:hypothetical protein